GSQVIQTFDGGFAITGIKGGGVSFVPYFLRIDSSGNLLSNRSYLWFADEHINSIVQTPGSGFLLAGYLYNGNNLVYFIRTDSVGDTLWTKSYTESFFNANVYSLRIAKDGGFIAAGSIQNTNTQDVDAFLFKTDSMGNIEWAKGYGDVGYDYAQQVEVASDSGFILAAVTYSFGAGLADYYLIKTDSLGNPEWSKTYGGTSDDRSESVHQLPDHGFLITGESASFSFGNFDVYMIRTDINGDTLWTKTVNGLENNEAYSMVLTADSAFAITGTYFNQFGNNDVLFLKSDASGFMGCSERSTATTVNIPATITTNHHLNYFPSQPSVVSHTLEIKSGARVETLCFPLSIESEINTNAVIIYPNPAEEKLTIDSKQFTISSIMVFDLMGTAVILRNANCLLPTELDLHQLTPGIFILQITFDQDVQYIRFVKE
ncbi:MAG: T9SS type A sorting domain-containing protein, partial [Bacteroidota bacterium]